MMMWTMLPNLPLSETTLEAFCCTHHIERFAVFGSVLRDDFDEASDVDVLVAFKPGHSPGWAFFRMQEELSNLLGREVDLSTFEGLYGGARAEILKDVRTLYDAA